jgi:hypothetical protein
VVTVVKNLEFHPVVFPVVSPGSVSLEEPVFQRNTPQESDLAIFARRTAFLARFIVLREGKRSRAHRAIELLHWEPLATAEDLAQAFRGIFRENGDNMIPVERDIQRSLTNSRRGIRYFLNEYAARASNSFQGALADYERSNNLLFSGNSHPRPGGWRLSKEIAREHSRELGYGKASPLSQ